MISLAVQFADVNEKRFKRILRIISELTMPRVHIFIASLISFGILHGYGAFVTINEPVLICWY